MEREGTLIGERYRLRHLLGEGGMAEVWLAVDERMQRPIAIKLLRPQYATDAALLERFRREAELVARLNSPHVIQVYDVGQSDGTSYIVMEYVEGQDLKELLAFEAPMPVERALRLLRDVAAGVGVAHRAGLIHRDLKPGNILISGRGDVKVTDFGIARQVASAGLTEPGTVWGTSHYIAPEQARGATLSPASDIYSLGVMLFEMLTAGLPFPGDDPVAVAIAHIQEPPPDLQTINPTVPTGVAQLVERMLAKEPERRPADGETLVQILDGYLRESGRKTVVQPAVHVEEPAPAYVAYEPAVPTPAPTYVAHEPAVAAPVPSPPPATPRPAPRTGTTMMVGGIIAILALCVLLGVVASQFMGNDPPDDSAALPTTETTQPVAAAEPSQTQTVAAAEPSATQPVIVVEPSVTQPVAAAEPSQTQPLPTLPLAASPTPPPTPEPPTAEPTATIPPPTPEPTATSAPILLPEGPNGPNAFAGLRDRDRRINVDGTLNDWDGITPVSVTSLVFEEQGTEPYTGLTDLSGQARLAWDEQNLYLAIDRTDDVFVQNTESYELYLGDSVELWIDTDLYGDQNVAEANGDDFHLAFSPGDFDRRRAEGVVYDPGAREQGRNEQLRVRAFPTSGAGYQLEVSIPWRVLGVEPREGLELGYAVALNDNDNPSISQQQTQVSTTRQVPFNRPQTFGTLILVP